ncbi:sulfite exporter TauE/SafE family protein [Azospirillum sp. ST 5-10]|uniref:sulfite exporter TauE/SafE family protein n=1 Tax=unclassified Azospirillum TaxID=2630922 RepID=UPI003F4A07F8
MDPAALLPTLALAAVAVALGGFVKGALGIGLPLVSVPVMALVMPVHQAVGLIVVPVIVTNVWQSLQGGHARQVVRRFWPLMAALVATILVTGRAMVALDPAVLNPVLGVAVILAALPILVEVVPTVPARAERWAGPLVGCIAGGLGGLSSFFGPPIAIYLLSLKLTKDVFVAAVALLYLSGMLGLLVALAASRVLDAPLLAASALSLPPAAAGMAAGTWLRRRIDQERFRKLVAGVLILIGLSFAWRSFA